MTAITPSGQQPLPTVAGNKSAVQRTADVHRGDATARAAVALKTANTRTLATEQPPQTHEQARVHRMPGNRRVEAEALFLYNDNAVARTSNRGQFVDTFT